MTNRPLSRLENWHPHWTGPDALQDSCVTSVPLEEHPTAHHIVRPGKPGIGEVTDNEPSHPEARPAFCKRLLTFRSASICFQRQRSLSHHEF